MVFQRLLFCAVILFRLNIVWLRRGRNCRFGKRKFFIFHLMAIRRTRTLKEIDPEAARSLMANYVGDETPDESRVHTIALQMKKGRFDTYGICLELDSGAHLTSGLLYVQAVVESHATVKIWVAENREV